MKVQDALDYANSYYFPELIFGSGYEVMEAERQKGEGRHEDPRHRLAAAGRARLLLRPGARARRPQPRPLRRHRRGAPAQRLERLSLTQPLDDDLCAGIGAIQKRSAASVAREVRGDRNAYAVAYVRKPIKGTILGIDIETTGTAPERGYILNVGWELMDLTSDAVPRDGRAEYFGIPEDPYKTAGVPLENIHHITWADIEGKTPFRENKKLQAQLLKLMKRYPIMAHNAAFEDSWFMLHLDGYAEARREGKIAVVDSRDICRKLDSEVASLPRESAPASLENWARRRGTLSADEAERHLGLDDTDLMLRTCRPSSTLSRCSPNSM